MANTRPNFMSDRDAGARDTVARKPAKAVAAPKKAARGAAKSVPTPTKRPSPNTASRSPAPASNPKNDSQYSTYSTSGGPQSAKRSASVAAPVSRGPSVSDYGAGMSTRKSVSNDQARYNSSKANAPKAKKTIFNSNSAMPGEDYLNKLGSRIKKKVFG